VKLNSRFFMAGATMSHVSSPDERTAAETQPRRVIALPELPPRAPGLVRQFRRKHHGIDPGLMYQQVKLTGRRSPARWPQSSGAGSGLCRND
jgi:hypothetical protein